jgi:uncharacterized protein with HEPN domain
MNERDRVLLSDMPDFARKAQAFLGDKSREALDADEVLTLALVKAVEIIGEAATRISLETQTTLPQLPWKAMTGMRNRIVHDYRNIDRKVVFDTITNDLPPLIAELEKVLPPEPPG